MRHRRYVYALGLAVAASSAALVNWVDVGQGTLANLLSEPPTTVASQSSESPVTQDQPSAGYLPGGFGTTHTDLKISDLSSFSDFPVYSAGKQVGPYLLTAILREHRKIEEPAGFAPVEIDNISLIYGDCVVSGDGGCAPPLVIQIWPNCQRPLAWAKALVNTRALGDIGSYTRERGAPAVELPDRTELATLDETIVVFGESKLRAQAISQLRPVNSKASDLSKSVDPVNLPALLPGALEPHASCT
jgi:hypothetical protein